MVIKLMKANLQRRVSLCSPGQLQWVPRLYPAHPRAQVELRFLNAFTSFTLAKEPWILSGKLFSGRVSRQTT